MNLGLTWSVVVGLGAALSLVDHHGCEGQQNSPNPLPLPPPPPTEVQFPQPPPAALQFTPPPPGVVQITPPPPGAVEFTPPSQPFPCLQQPPPPPFPRLYDPYNNYDSEDSSKSETHFSQLIIVIIVVVVAICSNVFMVYINLDPEVTSVEKFFSFLVFCLDFQVDAVVIVYMAVVQQKNRTLNEFTFRVAGLDGFLEMFCDNLIKIFHTFAFRTLCFRGAH
ncbi:hypothetical protein SUGI_0472500 [Cryptomeria japonica]|nr:hypothetical protein SUGI_0472500 [Cryptomeria japonica]